MANPTTTTNADEDHTGRKVVKTDPTLAQDAATKAYVDAHGGGAPSAGHYVTSQAESGLANEVNLGALSSGILKQSVAAGVSTPAIAVADTDYTANAFKTIAVSGQSNVVADAAADTLTLAAGTNVTITTNASTDTITIATAGGGTGTVTTTGSPATGNLTKFSGATSIVNGDLSGDVTTSGTLATTITSDAVTYAKIQNVTAASKLLGRGDSGAGDPQEITLGTNLVMSGTTLNANPSGAGVSQLVAGGGVAWTGTGFNYIISAATYIINGVQYNSPQTSVTLTAADATQDRIDVFYVATNGTVGVITGTPGTPPVQPSVDPGSQLQLTFAYVVAASTTPVITNVNIYLENTEYTMSQSGGTINLASTNNPFAGTKDIEGTSTIAGNFFTAVKPSGTLDLSQYTQLTLQVRSKALWANQKSISIFWMNGSTVVGSSVALKDGTFGFASSNTSSYQQIVIPASSFGTGTSAVDRLRMTIAGGGSSIGWYIDNIILQAGGGGSGGGGGTVTSFASGNLSPLFTTAVTTPTSTPIQSFSLSTAAANTVFGNNTGSTAAPAFSSTIKVRVNPRVTAIASNATWSPSADTDDIYEITAQAAAATTISNPSGTPVDGQKLIIRVKDNGTARALTWSGSQWRASSDLALPTTTILSKTLYLGFIFNSADTKWDLLALLNNF